MPLSRKDFVTATALVASSAALLAAAEPSDERSQIKFQVLKPSQYNHNNDDGDDWHLRQK